MNEQLEIKKNNFFQNIFSIRNNATHKILCIMGIKIKFYRKNRNIEQKLQELDDKIKKINSRQLLFREKDNFNIDTMSSLIATIQSSEYIVENMNNTPIFKNSHNLLKHAILLAPKDGLNLEFGVFSGRTINHLSNVCPERKFYGFDSFEGLPETWRTGFEKGFFEKETLPKVNCNVDLIKGWFNESLPKFLETHDENCAFIHVDCDLYSSTKTVFEELENRIKSGTIIVFDELFNYPGWKEHEFKAFMEFVDKNKIKFEYIGYVPSSQQAAVRIK